MNQSLQHSLCKVACKTKVGSIYKTVIRVDMEMRHSSNQLLLNNLFNFKCIKYHYRTHTKHLQFAKLRLLSCGGHGKGDDTRVGLRDRNLWAGCKSLSKLTNVINTKKLTN